MTTRAVIIAAGMGRRLLPHTVDRPKCMVDVAGRTMLDWQLAVMQEVGIEDVAVIRGYHGAAIQRPGLRFFDNPDYERNNILGSLLCAEPALGEGCVVSYSDILYGADALKSLLACDADIAAVVDVVWEEGYVGRVGHPLPEAELVRVEDGRIVEAGKGISAADAYGEFIGLMKLSAGGAATLCERYHQVRASLAGTGRPFQRAARFEQAYLTDMFQELAGAGVAVTPVPIHGGWIEIDVPGDLERARERWATRG